MHNSQIKYDKHECNHSFKPEIVCPKKKKIIFENEKKNVRILKKNILTADIEFCVADVTTKTHKYVIAEHIPKSVCYICKVLSNTTSVLIVSKDLLTIY